MMLSHEVFRYAHDTPPYAPEFRQQMVDLARAGRDPQDLARARRCERSAAIEPSVQAIRNWVADADRRDGRREPKPAAVDAALTSTERDELARLRRENKQLRLERDILSRAAAGPIAHVRWDPGRVRAGDRGRAPELFAFMSANQAAFPVAVMARVLGVSKAGFYTGRCSRGCRMCARPRATPAEHHGSMPPAG